MSIEEGQKSLMDSMEEGKKTLRDSMEEKQRTTSQSIDKLSVLLFATTSRVKNLYAQIERGGNQSLLHPMRV